MASRGVLGAVLALGAVPVLGAVLVLGAWCADARGTLGAVPVLGAVLALGAWWVDARLAQGALGAVLVLAHDARMPGARRAGAWKRGGLGVESRSRK